MIGFGSAGATSIYKGRRLTGRERLSWIMVGSGFVVAATGVLVVAVIGAAGGTLPAFGPTDLFFLVAYALAITGFASLPHLTSWAARTRVYLDSLVGALSLGAVMWVMLLNDLLAEFAQGSAWDRWAGSLLSGTRRCCSDGRGYRHRSSQQLSLRSPLARLRLGDDLSFGC